MNAGQLVNRKEPGDSAIARNHNGELRVLIIGGGVSGLTTALELQRRKHKVVIVAEKFGRGTTSSVAGALWEIPPAVCGSPPGLDKSVLKREQDWSLESYDQFTREASVAKSGVYLKPVTFFLTRPLPELAQERNKIDRLLTAGIAVETGAHVLKAPNIVLDPLWVDAYTYLTPMIDTDAYMLLLRARLEAGGCRFQEAAIEGSLKEKASNLRSRFAVDVIVNCTGIGARTLTSDDLISVRGAVLHVPNDGVLIPRIESAFCGPLVAKYTGTNAFLFVVPRGDGSLVLGGYASAEESHRHILLNKEDGLLTECIARCVDFMPDLAAVVNSPRSVVRTGHRPFRKGGVRVEADAEDSLIIHNYGHGGAGILLSWGCARAVAKILEEYYHAKSTCQ